MAASAATCAPTSTTTTAVARTVWLRNGSTEEAGGHESDWQKSVDRDAGHNTIQEKTHEFFQICDIEDKGFITRRDMQRLNGELPLSADELENVFDTLDSDGNGFLTLDEFSSGFSMFFNLMEEANGCKNRSEALYQSQWEERLAGSEDEEEKHFCMLMESLGASNVFEDPAEVRTLWAQLRRDEPHLLANFEDFLSRVTSQIKDANQEKSEMESALKRKEATHDNEIQRLYEEMEQQIKNEKDRIVLQDHERFLSRSQDLEMQLSSKERELEQLFQKQRRLECQCQELHSEQHVTKVENVKLKQTNDELTRELEHTNQELVLAQEQLNLLQEQSCRLHEEKEMEVYRVTEGLQRERASLLKQLDLLRYGSRDEDEEELGPNSKKQILVNGSCQNTSVEEGDSRPPPQRRHLQRIISIEEDHLPHLLQDDTQAQSPLQQWSEGEEENIDLPVGNEGERDAPTSPRGQPVGKETSEEGAALPPDRLFKIVLVGNSSVGKTSFLRRFCDDCFYSGTSATVGIDYSVKTITVDMSQVALQIWDTAGQERYRSITKQFFRKADGVVVMYEITSEQSFTAVRQWLTSVQEGSGEDIPIMLLGNKTDKESDREVQSGVGKKLAKDCQLIFYECSACSGHNVMESMVHLARILKEQEDKEKEKTIQLVSSPSQKKRSCC
uniref:Calcium release activated channel regulator 2A n=1 Tax=Myripristis murdjan TaxID=586833 RepID=A0A667ZI89_9TELE